MSAARAERRREPLLWIGLAILAVVLGLVVFGPWLAPFDPVAATDAVSQPPPPLAAWPGLIARGGAGRPVHWLGTDAAGFDVLSRTIAAPRTDLTIALTANLISFTVGVALGVVAGYFRHWSTALLVRVSDLLQSFPVFVSAMILVALAGRSWTNIIIAMAFLYTPIYLRLTRAEVMAQRRRGYVETARAVGLPEWAIALRHVMPNALAPAIIQASVTVGFAILLTAGLSFVGAGVRPPTPEWGLMIATGSGQMVLGDWWPSLVPGVAISLTVFGFAAVGHALERRHGG